MAFYRRRPRPDAEKCADPAKARASALETLAGQEVSANMLYERLCRRYTCLLYTSPSPRDCS